VILDRGRETATAGVAGGGFGGDGAGVAGVGGGCQFRT